MTRLIIPIASKKNLLHLSLFFRLRLLEKKKYTTKKMKYHSRSNCESISIL
jgi:hypothetical protein